MTELITAVVDDLNRAHDQLAISDEHQCDELVTCRIEEARELIERAVKKIQELRCDAIAALDKL